MARSWKGQIMGYSKESIKNAEEVSIVDYIDVTGIGEFTYRKGHQYKLSINGSDSVVIDVNKNVFYHNSVGVSGNVIKFIQHFEGGTFPEAVGKLLQFRRAGKVSIQSKQVEVKKEPFVYKIEHNPTTFRVERYLINERGIKPELVKKLISMNLLHEDKYGNAIFDWSDTGLPDGKRVGATKQGTIQRYDSEGNPLPKKYIEKNSELLGFNVTIGEPKTLYVFEAPIDLLSFWSLNPELENARLVAMDGVKSNALYAFLVNNKKNFGIQPDTMYIGTDNDRAGILFYEEVSNVFDIYCKNIHSLIPHRYEVLKEIYPFYEQVAKEYNVDRNLLMSIHQFENSGRLSNYSIHKESTNFFTTEDIKDESTYSIQEFINKLYVLAKTIQGKSVDEFIKEYYSEQKLVQSVKAIYEHYQLQNPKLVNEFQKDWNDILIKKPEVFTARIDKIPSFIYPYKDTNKEAIRNHFYKQHIAPEIIEHLMDKRLLRSNDNGNPVFVFNRYKQTVGAVEWKEETHRFEKLENSLKGNTFSVSLGTPETLIAFEDTNQLLRFWTLHKGNLNHTHLVSLDCMTQEERRECIQDRLSLLKDIQAVYLCKENLKTDNQLESDLEVLSESNGKGKLRILKPIFSETWAEELRKTRNSYLELAQQKQKNRGHEMSL